MNAKRLLKLADFLDGLPRQKFDFDQLIWQDGKPMLDALKAGKTRCGTVACAVGWLPAVFPRGLRWTGGDGSELAPDVVLRSDPDQTDFWAAADWFGITREDADFLFMPGTTAAGYSGLSDGATPKQVARHIRRYVTKQSPRKPKARAAKNHSPKVSR